MNHGLIYNNKYYLVDIDDLDDPLITFVISTLFIMLIMRLILFPYTKLVFMDVEFYSG